MPCRGITIRTNKPSHLRVVVSAVAVVQPCLDIVEVTAVSERVNVCDVVFGCDGVSVCIGYAEKFTPRIVGIISYGSVVAVDKPYNVALEIGNVIVSYGCCVTAGVQIKAQRRTVFVVHEYKSVSSIRTVSAHLNNLRTIQAVGVGVFAEQRFFCTDSVYVVLVGERLSANHSSRKLSAVFPSKGITLSVVVGKRISYGIIGDTLSVVRG